MSEHTNYGGAALDLSRPDAGDVLVAGFTQALEASDDPAAVLRLWSERHPTMARDFTEAAAALLGGDFEFTADLEAEEREIAALGRDLLRSRRSAVLLSPRVRECGFERLDDVARALRLPPGVLDRLDRGRISLQTLPAALLDALGQKLQWTIGEVMTALQAPQMTPANAGAVCEAPAGYWSQETFAEALAECASEDPEGARLWADSLDKT
ncbi:MAG: hypothetical protein ABIY70_15240 [Capsulimonas sp.]|uniref:hypothetical protein n=1 Tax=Capsulimonas sp. TaxID=2494211 RepID=UPI0032673C5E